jgi:VCBS repeat-containing protein
MGEHDPKVHLVDERSEIVELLEDLIGRLERGEPFQATLRVKHVDGTVEAIEIGYTSDEDAAAAMARILKVLGELH